MKKKSFDFGRKEAWGVSCDAEGVFAVLVVRRGSAWSVQSVIHGRLEHAAELKRLRQAFAKRVFFVPAGAGLCLSGAWKNGTPETANAKKMPSEFSTVNASYTDVNLSGVKSGDVSEAVRTQVEAKCSFGSPSVAFSTRSVKGVDEPLTLGVAIPDLVVDQDLRFWDAFGFSFPQISLSSMASINLFLAFAEEELFSEWTLLLHSTPGKTTCFQLLHHQHILQSFEAPVSLCGLDDEPFLKLLSAAFSQAKAKCPTFKTVADAQETPDAFLANLVFVAWGSLQEKDSVLVRAEEVQVERLKERFAKRGLRAFYFDPLAAKALKASEMHQEFLSAHRQLAQDAVGMAIQGL